MMAFVSLAASSFQEEQEETAFVVFAHEGANVKELSKKQVMGFFLGRNRFSSSSRAYITYDYPADSEVRVAFYEALTGKSITYIDAYVARLQYSGNIPPPNVGNSFEDIYAAVKENRLALGYAPADSYDLINDPELQILYVVRREAQRSP